MLLTKAFILKRKSSTNQLRYTSDYKGYSLFLNPTVKQQQYICFSCTLHFLLGTYPTFLSNIIGKMYFILWIK